MVKRAVAYARYSTSNQQETSIASQLSAIQSYCAQRGFQLLPQPYVDEACSGTNTRHDQFQRLMRDARAGLFDAVILYDLTRASRDIVDWFTFRKEMARLGIQVLSATGGVGDLDNPSDFLSESVQAAIGQFHVMQSRQKSIAGKTIRANRGLFCGGHAPLATTL